MPRPDYPVGVVAGVSDIPFMKDLIPAEDDGLVPRASTQVRGMTDIVIVEFSHSHLRYSKEVAQQSIAFLPNGQFRRDP